ncbi:ATP-binding cassette domain-containing protein [bacterium]|nr:ATP-binding cassette domain-containing protein [bacterium]MBU1065059.1 ATP-binding cassette domain-containing protein [bacterium]MBU1635220.1 ATP-binding cassette domain-containing protein [bacterium]MBU1874081.1 ATP-binding cassette domain-containing protein [bacterium]
MIEIRNLVKHYGDVKAVEDVSFSVKNGEILGFLGPNGAGKTTTLKVITGYLSPTSGNVFVDDLNVLDDSMEIRRMIGYLPEMNPLYHDMQVYDFLEFVARAREIDKNHFRSRLNDVIELCGLKGVVHKNINELSKGYCQRTGLAQAIIHDPKILILDEPTSGLDPNQIAEIRRLIRNLGKEKTVIISSHILQEMQATADRMIIINKGEIVANGTVDELMSDFKGKTRLTLELKNATEESVRKVQSFQDSILLTQYEVKGDSVTAVLEYPNEVDPREEIFRYAVKNKWTILEMSRHKTSLEEVFRTLTIEGGNNAK